MHTPLGQDNPGCPMHARDLKRLLVLNRPRQHHYYYICLGISPSVLRIPYHDRDDEFIFIAQKLVAVSVHDHKY